MPSLSEIYQSAVATPSDINEHLHVLRDHASDCKHITQFGARYGISTTAFMMANPEALIDWDIDPNAVVYCMAKFMAPPGHCGRVRYQPRVGNTLEIEIEPTDFLFIDSLHTYAQLKAELSRHASKVRRYLAFHDTEAFGAAGEDGTTPGLLQAIKEFQAANREWTCCYQTRANNGLVILEKLPFMAEGAPPPLCFYRQTHERNPERTD